MPAAGLAAQPHGGKAPGPQGDDPAARPARQRGAAVGGAVQVGQRHPPVLSERGVIFAAGRRKTSLKRQSQ